MRILKINSSALPLEHSVSRKQVEAITNQLVQKNSEAEIIDKNLPYIDDLHFLQGQPVAAFFAQERTAEQEAVIATSDALTDELINSDVLVIGAAMYNFTVPAALKAYIDLIVRAGKTFQYSSEGIPEGLLKNKKAYVVVSTGGTPLGSDYDYISGYLRTVLGFIGITDVTVVDMAADRTNPEKKEAEAAALIATF